MRTLVIADEVPWPAHSGYRIRLETVLRALATVGSLDLFSVLHDDREPSELPPPPADVSLTRYEVVANRDRRSAIGRFVRWIGGRRPRELVWHDDRAARAALAAWADSSYDLVWYSQADVYARSSGVIAGPSIVDLIDLRDVVLEHRDRLPVSSLRERAMRLADRVDRRRWSRLDRSIAARVAAVTVCSELDRARLGVSDAHVVPNAYPAPDEPTRLHEPTPGTEQLLFVGGLTYPPNEDAVRFFVRDVLPNVRKVLPGATARVVGRGAAAVSDLRGVPGVEIVGEVEDLRPELEAADLAVVPVRFGGGTRLKILEAFAYRIPVVSTTVGCEGLDVVDGREVAVADGADALANACIRVLTDRDLRRHLTDVAYDRWEQDFRSEQVEDRIVQVVRRVIEDES
jgi:glycosyltransferase involved in cell wall biosynthesis